MSSGSYQAQFLASRTNGGFVPGAAAPTSAQSQQQQQQQQQPPLITTRVHHARPTPQEEQPQQQQQQQQPKSSLLEAREWSKIVRFHASVHQQRSVKVTHEVLLSSALRKHSTAIEGNKLSLASCEITTFDLIAPATAAKVKTLYLGTNSFSSIENITQFSNLSTLSMSNNCIRYLSELRPLGALAQLDKLSLEGNLVASMPYYREVVIATCPHLTSLDNKKVTGVERSQCRQMAAMVGERLGELRLLELRYSALLHLLFVLRGKAELAQRLGSGSSSLQAPTPPLAALFHLFLEGGVYRWLQISPTCLEGFSRVVQDLSLIHISEPTRPY